MKRAMGLSPFQMVYGAEVVLPIHLEMPVMKLLQATQDELDDYQRRINQLIEAQESREMIHEKIGVYQSKMKALFDKKAKERHFAVGDLVHRWDAHPTAKGKHGKFDHFWYGPYLITKLIGHSFSLQKLDGNSLGTPVNGRFLKKFMQ